MGSNIEITTPCSKNGQPRSFVVIQENEINAVSLIRKYMLLRPKNCNIDKFFLITRRKNVH